jgi:galactose-1-phosphate uridylyltransferase
VNPGTHRRLNPLTREWVLVSPQRTSRPWHGQTERTPIPTGPVYDPTCPADEHLHPEWHFHAHFYPPLLRSATIRKFMVGLLE